jgi:predicted acetyltransferase
MKQQVIDLWKLSFGDTGDFIRLYFDRVYKAKYTLTYKKGGRLVSALQMLPYEMTYGGTTIPVAYVCGVCTHPSERGKGLMTGLMQQAIQEMQRRKYALTVLIPASPWLFEYYNRFGYVTAFDYSLETHHLSTAENPTISCRKICREELSSETIYAYFDRKQRERAYSILHTAFDLETILNDCLLSGGDIRIALQDGKPAGMAISVPSDRETVFIKEILYDSPDVKKALIQSVLTRFQCETAKVRIPPVPIDSIPYGMARILDKQRMIDLYQSSNPPLSPSENPDNATLTQKLLNYGQKQACMNLMLD